MILFKDDWGKFPSAIIDVNTTNLSFLRLAALYREMGVENHAFMLVLTQPELVGIDPHREDLSMDIMAMVLYEVKVNPWYFFREVARFPPLTGTESIRFKANRFNIALYWLFFNHITTITIIPRQTGKSASVDMLMTWLRNYGTVNTMVNMLTRSDGLRVQNLDRLKKIQEELPFYLDFKSKGDLFNTEEIKFYGLGNSYKGNLSNMSPKLANNVGRGFTSPILHVDEACFVANIGIALPAALMAGNASRDSAKANKMPYGTILTTTAGEVDDRDGAYIHKIWNAATVLDEKFYDTENLEVLYNLIMTNCNAGLNETKRAIVNITLSYRQLGYDDAWMKEKLLETMSEGPAAVRDLFNMWTSGSNSSPIPKEYLDAIKNSVPDRHRSEIYAPYNYILNWYATEEDIQYRINNGINFIVGIDTSDAVGRDDIAFIMRDHSNGEILCVATFNEVNLITLADFFVSFLLKYPNSVMIIERRSSAATIIDYIIQKLCLNEINPFKRLYNTIVQEKERYKDEFEEIMRAKYYNENVFIKYKKHIGFATSGTGITSRSELYSTTLINMCKFTSHCVYDNKLAVQLLGLIIKNNKVDHATNGNDDCVIGALLSFWLLTVGRNLSVYGINTGILLKSNKVYLNEKYSGDYDNEQELIEAERKFLELIEAFKGERNELIARQIECKIKLLASDLNNTFNKTISVEALFEEIVREKRLRLTN